TLGAASTHCPAPTHLCSSTWILIMRRSLDERNARASPIAVDQGAAVDDEALTGHVARLRRHQEVDDARHFPGLAEARHRNGLHDTLGARVAARDVLPIQPRIDPARDHRI